MKITLILGSVAVLLTLSMFPKLSAESLNDKSVTLPEDAIGKQTLVVMSYSKKAEKNLKTWITPLYDKFILKRGMFDKNYDINTYFIPMFTGIKKSAYEGAKKKLMESNQKNIFDHILFYKGELEPYKSELNLKEKDVPYLFLLNESGEIIHKEEGTFTEEKLEKIEDLITVGK